MKEGFKVVGIPQGVSLAFYELGTDTLGVVYDSSGIALVQPILFDVAGEAVAYYHGQYDVKVGGTASDADVAWNGGLPYLFPRQTGVDLSVIVPFTVFDATKDPTGFISPADVIITGNLDRTVTLTGTLDYLWRGRAPAVPLVAPWVSPAHAVGDGPHYLYSTDGINFVWSDVVWGFDSIHLARHYKGRYFRESHGLMPWQVHFNLHNSPMGNTMRLSGGSAIAGTYALDTAGNAAVTPDFAQAVILDEDNPTTIPTVIAGQYCHLYFSGNRVVENAISQALPYRVGAAYPLINVPTAGVFADVETTTGKFVNVYQLLVPAALGDASQAVRMMFLQPQAAHSSLSAAQAENPFNLDTSGLGGFATELVTWTRLTYQTNAAYTATGKVRLAAIQEGVWKLNVAGVGVGAVDSTNVTATATGSLPAGTVASQTALLEDSKATKHGFVDLDDAGAFSITGGATFVYTPGLAQVYINGAFATIVDAGGIAFDGGYASDDYICFYSMSGGIVSFGALASSEATLLSIASDKTKMLLALVNWDGATATILRDLRHAYFTDPTEQLTYLKQVGGTATGIKETLLPEITAQTASLDWGAGHAVWNYAGTPSITAFTNVPTDGTLSDFFVYVKHNGGIRTLGIPVGVEGTLTTSGTSGGWDVHNFFCIGDGVVRTGLYK